MIARALAAPALIVIALLASACPLASGGGPRRAGDIIRDTDAAMAAAGSYQVDGEIAFDVSVLPDIGRVTGHADVVRPDSYVMVQAGSERERVLVRDGVLYTASGSNAWQPAGTRLSSPAQVPSPYAETAALLAMEVFGDFESRPSDRPGTELLRYEMSITDIADAEKTILGIVIPDAKDILDLVNIKGTLDFDFYIDAGTHRIDEIVIGGNAKAIGIPVNISGTITYYDYDSKDIEIPDPGDASGTSTRIVPIGGGEAA